ncbi:MAG: hypothetical protein FJ144_16305, partial [Deltaproteobacteria bacterium]|nr:hypothetical protein [Deltaproteobacteria bacterium]
MHSSFGLRVPFDRPPFYGVFLLLTHAGLTLWTVPLAQSAILVGLLRILVSSELNRLCPRGRDVTLVALAAFLTIGTPLPWFTAQLVPDAMTGSGVLALFLMVRGRTACPMEKWFVRVTFVVFMLVHLSHLALGI